MNILLIEPDYKNKYPPLGLMKIATYHKSKGHNVLFIKGISDNLPHELWDRIYITTLFTFYFDITVKTIRFYKKYVRYTKNMYVGGILASLMPDDLIEATGLDNVVIGQLDNSKKIGYHDSVNIDNLPLDYNILQDVEYKYPAGDNYFAYTTRGCPNKCKFCAVPKLEPKFKTTNNIYNQIKQIDRRYGQKRNLLLLDNNILHSPRLSNIIGDIKKAGFENKPNYIEPHEYEIFLRKFSNHNLGRKDIDKTMHAMSNFVQRIKDEDDRSIFLKCINNLARSKNVAVTLNAKKGYLLPIIQKYKKMIYKQRHVDFNQGIDAFLLDEKRMKMLSSIPIRPLRIAFDHWGQRRQYENAVRRAAEYQIKDISNYLLYNYVDKPIELWERINLNTKLRQELDVNIFSFPMKYSPVDKKDRNYIGLHWNKKYIRAIQSILLVKKGIVSTQQDFVERAFGKNPSEYFKILAMPEDFIIYRTYFEDNGMALEWGEIYDLLSHNEKMELLNIINGQKKNLKQQIDKSDNKKFKKILKYYSYSFEEMNRGKT